MAKTSDRYQPFTKYYFHKAGISPKGKYLWMIESIVEYPYGYFSSSTRENLCWKAIQTFSICFPGVLPRGWKKKPGQWANPRKLLNEHLQLQGEQK